ncbi:MAG: hypothetical protein ACPKQO_00640 [Nitrososphaeraceae archaeon]
MSEKNTNHKEIQDYSINENQFAIEYDVVFKDGSTDYFIELKIAKTSSKIPDWVEHIKQIGPIDKKKSNIN